MQQQRNNRGCLQIMRDQAWAFVFGFLGLIVALASLVFAIPQAAPIRSGLAQTFSGTAIPATTSTLIASPPPLAPAETIPENIVLTCNDCSNPLVITITSIKVEPQNNRMIWNLSLFNNTQSGILYNFVSFTLQDPISDNAIDASIPDNNGIRGGDTSTVYANFSFVPRTKVQYVLNAKYYLGGVGDIQFTPVTITF